MTTTTSNIDIQTGKDSYPPDKFFNSDPTLKPSSSLFEILKAYLTTKRRQYLPTSDIPIRLINTRQLTDEQDNVVYRLGHSSVLLKLSGQFVMTDPVFSERASPFRWCGPKRFHQPPVSLDALPKIDIVILSHDHYDHLDKAAIRQLDQKVTRFLVPLKVGARLIAWGVPRDKIIEFDWWQSYTHNQVEYVFTPAQHFSGRSLRDRNTTLWGSWVIKTASRRLYFSGDSGYFTGFKQIGDKFGPFDLTLIETGAYNKLWANVHMFPEQSVQAHLDLQGKVMMPIHNSTFNLSMHDWFEPLQRAHQLCQFHNIVMAAPEIGQRMQIEKALPVSTWWEAAPCPR
jgi:L-ascorbate metabolism protein UlaG (beta-lactamase superfamily)